MQLLMHRLKPDWSAYLHALRERETALIFSRFSPATFACGLELGAGDGFQSRLLAGYVRQLIVTDYRPAILAQPARPGITYRLCDAERVDEVFAPAQFDLIFSSNLLEHLPDVPRGLAGVRRVLADDGIAIHVVPSPFWKLCHVVGFYPNAVVSRLDRLSARRAARLAGAPAMTGEEWDNNPKTAGRRYSYLRRLVAPVPHGVSAGNLAEFSAFSPRRWRAEFAAAGFRVAAVLPGPLSSGYGFGLDGLRRGLERLGLASEYVYVTVKAGHDSPHLAAFEKSF